MTHSIALDALPAWLARETAGAGAEVGVLAGHFAIYSAGNAARDLLDEGDMVPSGAAEMLNFTRLSWRIACDVATEFPERAFRVVALVDDIQFIRPLTAERAMSERLAAALASDYLGSVRQLPPYHTAAMTARGISAERIVRWSEDRWLFSERGLREAAVHHVRRHFAARGSERAGLTSTDNGNTMNVTLPEQGDYCLVQSGHTSCAGGYVELLSTLHDRGIRKLIAFVPMRCLGQVALGTDLAHHLYDLHNLAVINVAIPDADVGRGAIITHQS